MRATPALLAACVAACGFDPVGGGGDDDGGPGDARDAPGDDDADPGDGPPAVDAADGMTVDARPSRKRRLTIDGALVLGNHTDFPLWVAVVDPAGLGARAQADGSDIYFTTPGGVVLVHELQRYVSAEGRLEAWVKLPTLTAGAAAAIDLHYGDPALAPAPTPIAVWSNAFHAVWHLDAASPATQPDATGMRDATASGGMSATDVVAGRLGRGLRFDGDDDQLAFTSGFLGGGPHTISAWVDQRATTNNDALVVLGNAACFQSRWLHTRFDQGTIASGFYCSDWPNSTVDIQGDGWVLLHWVYDGNTSGALFIDGVRVAGPFTYASAAVTVGTDGYIGNAPSGFGQNMGLNATLDEVRLARAARSAGWIATEYANQSSPATFYTLGPEE